MSNYEACGHARMADYIRCPACVLQELDSAKLQLREAQEVINLCVAQGGLSFHDEWRKCPEDDTCDCPDVKRVNAAMNGYTEKRKHMCCWENGGTHAAHTRGCDCACLRR